MTMEVIRDDDGSFRIECDKIEAAGAIFGEAIGLDLVSASEIGFVQLANLEVVTDDDGMIVKVIAHFPK